MKRYVAICTLAVLFIAGCGEPETADSSGTTATSNGSDNFVNLDDASGYAKVFFDFDKYDIRSDMEDRVEKSAAALKSTGAKVVLEGHTDSYGSDTYNYALGTKRANAVKNALIARGVNASQLKTVSYGESKPVCTTGTSECNQENRRVEFKLAK
ncbi:peptidoglycan-binding protein [Helicobacter sp. MIT 05-5293]|uniref:Peptidoglycan-associated lipoprotein n=1 Tax=uncultured Helicobacter sp. TaxID=175537 RepID=A0A650EJX6_9HELI|nr:OmpA family protein [Helicobacter sp. MIT 05-5293]QGT50047.1 peptidoglycan-associated lipoprotein [uncultured Helicobacter sp.]TLD81747.1 peptidoglycan-binding protein [Helicobacter sp. MIT 05-5293]